MPDQSPLIEIRGLKKYYRMGDSVVRALDGVDLTIRRGEFVAITGASGSGKSTMMHLIGCLDRPSSGEYILDGQSVSRLNDRALADTRNRRIGFVFQTFNLINRTTALDNVAVPLFYARRANARGPALRALERVGLGRRSSHKPNELSGGERQRVAIARAIVNDPVLILADEPTGNLDSRTGEQIMEIFHALNAAGATIVIVTHEPEIAAQARRIVHMKDGKIVTDEPNAPPTNGRVRTTPHRDAAAPLEAWPAAHTDAAAPLSPPPDSDADAIDVSTLPPRMAPGATASMACGVVALTLFLVWAVTQTVLVSVYAGQYREMQAGKPVAIPPAAAGIAIATAIASIAGLVLAILAIVFGMGARRRVKREIGNWRGRARAGWGILIGWAAIATPIVVVAISIATRGK